MVSVGARTTSEHEVAIWSNTGSWVMAYGAGASVVSTMPTTFNGSRRSGLAQPAAPGQPARGTGDSDDFSGGFGVWSGTSFSTPALAGWVALALLLGGGGATEALAGTSPGEAFFVNIGRSTMTQDDIDNGRLICYIGIAPVKPAEFVIFRISQKTRLS